MNVEEPLSIRPALRGDLKVILDLYAALDIDRGSALTTEQAENIFDRMASYPNYKVYVAESDGVIVGTFALAIMDNLAHMGMPSGLVEDVVVRNTARGKGIGKQMMLYALEECRKAGCYKLALSSNLIRTEAHRFYESLGFEKHGYSFLVDLKRDAGM